MIGPQHIKATIICYKSYLNLDLATGSYKIRFLA